MVGLVLAKFCAVGLFEPIALGVIVIYVACVFPYLGNFGRFGDFSYGVYIVHFPILQFLIALGMFQDRPFTDLVFAATLVMFAAFLMWHLIEKRFLRKSSHYVVVTN